jgi:hypothetical protein
LLVGGAGVEKIKSKCGLRVLPPMLMCMRNELAEMRSHMMANCPAEWRTELNRAKYDSLTLGSWHYQLGERKDLDLVTLRLQAIGVTCHGWLGDSILASTFAADEFCRGLEKEGIYITVRHFPRKPMDYFAAFKDITAQGFDESKLTERQERQASAYADAAEWLRDHADNPKMVDKMPHLQFAIAIEASLPSKRSIAGKTELYVPEHGVWTTSGGVWMSVETISDALLNTFGKRHWTGIAVDGEFKMRLIADKINMFFTASVLNTIADMSKKLSFDADVEALDMAAGIEKLKNFRGPLCLDFSTVVPKINWADDGDLTAALNLPVRLSTIADRTTRSVPRVFEEYASPGKLSLARAIEKAMVELGQVNGSLVSVGMLGKSS